ncbi:MAG: CRISPR-associated protein [Symploca sp. SIO1B1]|nr:CRISPR-associated protein [Symploca sp. SIO1B1]
MFKHLIIIHPLGLMYGSSGAFLSPENLVGRSGAKFPPEAATLAGLFFSANKVKPFISHKELRDNLFIAGPFWANEDDPEYFYLPIPWHKIIAKKGTDNCKQGVDEWQIQAGKWTRTDRELEPDYRWQRVNSWCESPSIIKKNQEMAEAPWTFLPILHPRTKDHERHVLPENGLFLENAVQMLGNKYKNKERETCLVYLSTHTIPDGWYRFGGENHLVEISSEKLDDDSPILELLRQPIHKACALITPGIWGSNHLSYRYPKHSDFPKHKRPKMLTDRPISYRYRSGGKMGRGRYAVPPGSVYIFEKPLNKTWWEFPQEWFPQEGFNLKQVGCNLCLPIEVDGVD